MNKIKKNPLGHKFWNKISKISLTGQISFPFGNNPGGFVRDGSNTYLPVKPKVKYKNYRLLVDLIFENLPPERITLGSLRGLQSTINGCSDKSWVKYLKESSNWGKKIDFQTRFTMYSEVTKYLKSKFDYEKVALCKETIKMWSSLKMNYRQIRCNCIS